MSLFQQTVRKALKGLLPICIVDIVAEYLPRVEIISRYILETLSNGPVTFEFHRGPIGLHWDWFQIIPTIGTPWEMSYNGRPFSSFTINTLVQPIQQEFYIIEFDPDLQTIISFRPE
jgi:hypothetical protein